MSKQPLFWFIFLWLHMVQRVTTPQQPSVAQELSWCRPPPPPPPLLKNLLSYLPNIAFMSHRLFHQVIYSQRGSLMWEDSVLGGVRFGWLREGKLSEDGVRCAWIENNVKKEKWKLLVSEHTSSQTCVTVYYCEMSLMRDSTVCSFQMLSA